MNRPDTINEMVKAHIDINEHMKIYYFYIKDNNFKYDLILNRS